MSAIDIPLRGRGDPGIGSGGSCCTSSSRRVAGVWALPRTGHLINRTSQGSCWVRPRVRPRSFRPLHVSLVKDGTLWPHTSGDGARRVDGPPHRTIYHLIAGPVIPTFVAVVLMRWGSWCSSSCSYRPPGASHSCCPSRGSGRSRSSEYPRASASGPVIQPGHSAPPPLAVAARTFSPLPRRSATGLSPTHRVDVPKTF